MDNRELSDYAICNECGHANLIWQCWCNLFRCGWCGKDYTVKEAENLKKLSGYDHFLISSHRKQII